MRLLSLTLILALSACAGAEIRDTAAEDRDKDGVSDDLDRCLGQAGPMDNLGCPDRDEDQDGVIDRLDSCPLVAGSAASAGCPDINAPAVAAAPSPAPTPAGEARVDKGGARDGAVQTAPAGEELVRVRGRRLQFAEPVTFEPATATLTPRGQALLEAAARLLMNHPEWRRLLVEGHVDEPGNSAARARALSQQRAEVVKQALVKIGVGEGRLRTQGFGYSRLLDRSETPAAQKINNRIEIAVID